MTIADRVKDTTTTSGTGTVTLAQSAQTGFQLFGTAFSAASTVTYCISSRTTADWEVGNGTFTPPATLTRSPTASSNANGLVNFGAEIKDVFVTQSASNIAKQLISDDISFTASVPFTGQGVRYMPQQTVASVIAFTPNATGALKNAQVYIRLLADAVNVPTFVGFKEWGGSLGYDNRNQIANQITFWYDGYDYWFSVSQAVGAVAAPVSTTGLTLAGPTSGVASTASSNFTVGVTPAGSALSGTVRVTPNDASGGGTFTPAFLDLTGTSATGTFTYTPSATVTTRTISITNNGGLTNPTSISYSVTAAASAGNARLTALVHVTESGTGPYTYTSDTTAYASSVAGPGGVVTTSLASATDGSLAMTLGNYQPTINTREAILGITLSNSLKPFNTLEFGMYSQGNNSTTADRYAAITSGAIAAGNGTSTQPMNGDIMRLRRTGTSIIAEVARSAAPTTFVTVHTFSGVSTAVAYGNVNVAGGAVASNITTVGFA